MEPMILGTELRAAALEVLQVAEPEAKAAAARALRGDTVDPQAALQPSALLPGRAARPLLVHPSTLAPRSAFTPEGRAALLHAVAHIELNAIKTVYKERQIGSAKLHCVLIAAEMWLPTRIDAATARSL
jgi:uncharacterized ferritin-like protein (DUF455 family)